MVQAYFGAKKMKSHFVHDQLLTAASSGHIGRVDAMVHHERSTFVAQQRSAANAETWPLQGSFMQVYGSKTCGECFFTA